MLIVMTGVVGEVCLVGGNQPVRQRLFNDSDEISTKPLMCVKTANRLWQYVSGSGSLLS